jgi:hypothetical protein
MDPLNHISSRIVETLSTLAPDKPSLALNARIAQPLKRLSIYRILEIRCAIMSSLNPEVPSVAAVLDLIDGQIALREIAGDASWR